MRAFLIEFFANNFADFQYTVGRNEDFVQSLVAFGIGNICYSGSLSWGCVSSHLIEHCSCPLQWPLEYPLVDASHITRFHLLLLLLLQIPRSFLVPLLSPDAPMDVKPLAWASSFCANSQSILDGEPSAGVGFLGFLNTYMWLEPEISKQKWEGSCLP